VRDGLDGIGFSKKDDNAMRVVITYEGIFGKMMELLELSHIPP
jgi:hypothetical protein